MPNAFAHVELNTQDLKKAKKFYQSLFDWKLSEAPGGIPYTMIDVGTGTGGGMAALQEPGGPSAWLPYVVVDDVKKTLAKAVKGGATIKLDYMSIGDMGAIGVFVDPTGAALGLWETAKGAQPPAEPAAEPAAKKASSKAPPPAKKASAKKAAAPVKKTAAPAKAATKKGAAPAKAAAQPKAVAKKAPAPAKKASKKKA